jgi:Holliday junction resolvase
MQQKKIGSERDLYKKIKREIKSISWIRIENWALLGTPDLLGYSPLGNFFTLELKATKSNKVQLSPHQVSFHMKHKTNTFVLVACALKLGSYRLYPGHRILELVDSGLKLEPLCAGWEACRLKLESL